MALSTALSASWLRCPVERRSPLTWSGDGSPSMHGFWSSGLHIPGAADLADTASHRPRVSGSMRPRTSLVPSRCCLPTVKKHRRARSSSERSPS